MTCAVQSIIHMMRRTPEKIFALTTIFQSFFSIFLLVLFILRAQYKLMPNWLSKLLSFRLFRFFSRKKKIVPTGPTKIRPSHLGPTRKRRWELRELSRASGNKQHLAEQLRPLSRT